MSRIASLICSFYYSVAARQVVLACPSLRYTLHVAGTLNNRASKRQPTKQKQSIKQTSANQPTKQKQSSMQTSANQPTKQKQSSKQTSANQPTKHKQSSKQAVDQPNKTSFFPG